MMFNRRERMLIAGLSFIGLAILVLMMLVFYGCSTLEWNKAVWHKVQADNPACHDKPMPEVEYITGLYLPARNKIFLCDRVADVAVMEHEMLHSCNGFMGEVTR